MRKKSRGKMKKVEKNIKKKEYWQNKSTSTQGYVIDKIQVSYSWNLSVGEVSVKSVYVALSFKLKNSSYEITPINFAFITPFPL